MVTYNRLDLLKECVRSLLNQKSFALSHLLVINNNSNDGTTDYLNEIRSDVIFPINLQKNLGGAAGFELGVKKAYELFEDDYVWIMDDDTIPEDHALSSLINAAQNIHDDFGFLCSNVRWINGDGSNVPKTTSRWSNKIGDGLIQVETATFVSVFISRRVIKEVGLPAGDLYIWGDDTEYTKRISTKEKSYFVENSKVLHKTKNNLSSMTIRNDDAERIDRYFYMYRNLIYISRMYYGKKHTMITTLKYILLSFSLLFTANNKRLKRFLTVLKAVAQGIKFRPKINFVR